MLKISAHNINATDCPLVVEDGDNVSYLLIEGDLWLEVEKLTGESLKPLTESAAVRLREIAALNIDEYVEAFGKENEYFAN